MELLINVLINAYGIQKDGTDGPICSTAVETHT